ncbi:MAG: hypothetical protein J0L75_19785 [Spirochaetes bacterium]|nr:hypothetical protein [Spirochaetota bacterium]
MSFIILLVLNALFAVCVFLYFRERFQKLVQADSIKQELAAVIHAFNQQADSQISLLEDLVRRTGEAQEALDLRLAELKRLDLYGGEAKRISAAVAPGRAEDRAPTGPEAAAIRPPRRRVPKEEAPEAPAAPVEEEAYLLEVDEGSRKEEEAEERLVNYLRQREQERFDRFPISEKVKFLYRQKGENAREIARKLGLSLTEIQMILQEPIR